MLLQAQPIRTIVAQNLSAPTSSKASATSGGSGHAAGPTALPPKADLQAATSASPLISSASPPGADLPGGAPVGPLVTPSGSATFYCAIATKFVLLRKFE